MMLRNFFFKRMSWLWFELVEISSKSWFFKFVWLSYETFVLAYVARFTNCILNRKKRTKETNVSLRGFLEVLSLGHQIPFLQFSKLTWKTMYVNMYNLFMFILLEEIMKAKAACSLNSAHSRNSAVERPKSRCSRYY